MGTRRGALRATHTGQCEHGPDIATPVYGVSAAAGRAGPPRAPRRVSGRPRALRAPGLAGTALLQADDTHLDNGGMKARAQNSSRKENALCPCPGQVGGAR